MYSLAEVIEQILGIIPLGTSLDSETQKTRQLGCWDGPNLLSPFVNAWTTNQPAPGFEPSDAFCDAIIAAGFNNCSAELHDFWSAAIKGNYQGDDGRRRIRMATINLAERGGLLLRLSDVQCPVLWLHVCSVNTTNNKWNSG